MNASSEFQQDGRSTVTGRKTWGNRLAYYCDGNMSAWNGWENVNYQREVSDYVKAACQRANNGILR